MIFDIFRNLAANDVTWQPLLQNYV